MSLQASGERLDAAQLRAGAAARIIGREIVVIHATTSTNDAVLRRALTGEGSEGLAVFAETQTEGRGQRGNRWESVAGRGLWFSFLLRPERLPLDQSARLTSWATRSLAEVLREELALDATIKPPNDVYIGGRKVAGVLVEMRAQPKEKHLAIVGIGVNINQSSGDFSKELRERAISLAMVCGRNVDRANFAVALLRKLDRLYQDLFR